MAYIGNTPISNFASITKDAFSGDGSTTAFTLSKAATTNGVAVFVENVRQEPTTAYAVSGTTLTFTAAPVSASGNNIYVLHHNTPASTATHPSAQDLTAANATLTGDVTVGSGTAADRKIVFDGNAVDYHIGLDDSADTLNIGKGSTLGTTTAMTFDTNGIITMPLQPAFLVTKNANQTDIAEGSNVTVTFETEIFDQNADFASNTFTAPVTGRYQLNATVRLQDLDVDAHYIYLYVTTSNRNYQNIVTLSSYDEDIEYLTLNVPVLADMDASDTAYVILYLEASGNVQVDVKQHESFFSGYLVA